jgi:hypothetical protein
MSLPPEMRTVSSLRAEIDRMADWLDRLHAKYGAQPPQALVDTAYEKLAAAVGALNELE